MRLNENELPKMLPVGKAKNLERQRFGKLVVKYRCEYPEGVPHTSAYWVALCDCGYYTQVRGSHLIDGRINSCGHGECKTEDLTGQKFNKLTVLERVENRCKSVMYKCLCDCGNETIVAATHLKDGHTRSCGCILSVGESEIGKLLTKNNIKFQSQKSYEDCRFSDTNAKAKFDFYLPDYNCLIEFDGIQHFYFQKTSKIFTEEKLKKTQQHDAIKNQYCFDHNIPLIRIPYTYLDNITLDDLLPETSQFLMKTTE